MGISFSFNGVFKRSFFSSIWFIISIIIYILIILLFVFGYSISSSDGMKSFMEFFLVSLL